MCGSSLDTLQWFDHRGRESSQEWVVEEGDDECSDRELSCFPREEGPDPGDVTAVMLAVQHIASLVKSSQVSVGCYHGDNHSVSMKPRMIEL